MNFRAFDLNLLRVLDAMLSPRNTTRVGETVGLSQPAVSSALRRLRDILGDPLFVREGNLLVPTGFALSLQVPVRAALESLEHALSGGGSFDPSRSQRSFVIGASDYFHEMLMPQLADLLTRNAPNMRLKMLPAATASFPAMLAAERFDVVLSISIDPPVWIEKQRAFQATNMVVARQDHPMLRGLTWGSVLPLDLFCGLPHVIFSVTDDFSHFEDAALERIGRSRNVRFTMPGYYGVGRVAAQSDLIGVLPARFALSVADKLGLVAYRLPFEMPLIDMYLYWRKRDMSNREHEWLRGLIIDLLKPLDEVSFPVTAEEFGARPAWTRSPMDQASSTRRLGSEISPLK
jgi:DNA-binding transcriptional LysR family regulator